MSYTSIAPEAATTRGRMPRNSWTPWGGTRIRTRIVPPAMGPSWSSSATQVRADPARRAKALLSSRVLGRALVERLAARRSHLVEDRLGRVSQLPCTPPRLRTDCTLPGKGYQMTTARCGAGGVEDRCDICPDAGGTVHVPVSMTGTWQGSACRTNARTRQPLPSSDHETTPPVVMLWSPATTRSAISSTGARFNRDILAEHRLFGTGTTGGLIGAANRSAGDVVSPWGFGGVNSCRGDHRGRDRPRPVSFRDPLEPQPHDSDVRAIGASPAADSPSRATGRRPTT